MSKFGSPLVAAINCAATHRIDEGFIHASVAECEREAQLRIKSVP